MGKTVLYVRVSTAEQTSDHQITQARAAGHKVEDRHVIVDHGVSGVRVKLADRDQGRRLFDLLQPGDTLLVRWVDRLGRNYEDVSNVMRQFMDEGVTVRTLTNGMVFDGQASDPMAKAVRDAQIAFLAALAQADAEAKAEARQAGITHAKARVDAGEKYRGRKPAFDRNAFEQVQTDLAAGTSPARIARGAGVSRQIVYRIKDDPGAADAALRRWGM